MSAPPCSPPSSCRGRLARRGLGLLGLAALAGGCAEPQSVLLPRLLEAWSQEAADIASPSVTAALVMGGLATDLCVRATTGTAEAFVVGQPPPLDPLLVAAMGDPVVASLETFGNGSIEVLLIGVSIMDRESATVRYVTTPGAGSFSVEAVTMDGKLSDEDVSSGTPFGRIAVTVDNDCQPGSNRVQGSAKWTDLAGRAQAVEMPAEESLSQGVGFGTDPPWIPAVGTLSWTGRLEDQDRTVTTIDAADIVVEETTEVVPEAIWPATTLGEADQGEEWEQASTLWISP